MLLLRAVLRLAFSNSSGAAVDGVMIQFNRNSFGLAPAVQAVPLGPLPPGASATVDVALAQSAALVTPGPATALLQVWLRVLSIGSSASCTRQWSCNTREWSECNLLMRPLPPGVSVTVDVALGRELRWSAAAMPLHCCRRTLGLREPNPMRSWRAPEARLRCAMTL